MGELKQQHRQEIKIFDNEIKRLKPKRIRFSKVILNMRHDLG